MDGEVDTAMLASMREAIGQLLPDKCNIQTVTLTPDGMGGETQTWTATQVNIPFRLDMESGSEMLSGGALQPYTKYKGSLPYDAVVTAADRITHKGVTYVVTGVNNGQSWSAVIRVDLERI